MLPLLIVAVPLLHDLPRWFQQPYWVDEAWVALSDKASWSQLRWVAGPTPIGWELLVRLFPADGQVQRLVPFAFLVGAVASAYAFGHGLGWPGRRLRTLAASLA